MTAKRMQNSHEKAQPLEWVKNSKLFHKRYANISTAYEFDQIIEILKSYKNQNQINIFEKKNFPKKFL